MFGGVQGLFGTASTTVGTSQAAVQHLQLPADAAKMNALTKDHAAAVDVPTPVADAAWDRLAAFDQLTYSSLFQPPAGNGSRGLLGDSSATVTTLDRVAEIIELARKSTARPPPDVRTHGIPGFGSGFSAQARGPAAEMETVAWDGVTILSVIGEYASGFAECLQAAIQQTTEQIVLLRSEQPMAGEPESDAAAEARGASELQQAMAGHASVLFLVVHCTPPNVTSASDRTALMDGAAYLRGQLRLVTQLEATLSKYEMRHQRTRREVQQQQQTAVPEAANVKPQPDASPETGPSKTFPPHQQQSPMGVFGAPLSTTPSGFGCGSAPAAAAAPTTSLGFSAVGGSRAAAPLDSHSERERERPRAATTVRR
jgi:hypothetical protein